MIIKYSVSRFRPLKLEMMNTTIDINRTTTYIKVKLNYNSIKDTTSLKFLLAKLIYCIYLFSYLNSATMRRQHRENLTPSKYGPIMDGVEEHIGNRFLSDEKIWKMCIH